VVAVTYYSTTVKLPENIELPLSSTIMYAGSKKQIAKVGEVNRSLVKINQIPQYVQHAVASAEDRNFYKHEGIDYLGIARAAWNNLTGGDTQGASTITQQYARNALELEGVTYARKVREAVLASKLSDKYTREQIMEFYLNTIYFGRGAYSIESAAQVYFKKPVNRLSKAEAAVLAAVIKQPVPDKATGHQGYDPGINKEAAVDRWNYVLDGMVEKGWLDAAERQTLKYPAYQPVNEKASCTDCGLNTPAGNVVNYVAREMAEMGLCEEGKCMAELRKGGYRVTTSIDPDMQKAAEEAAWRKIKDSELAPQPKNLMAALVSIDPNTGRVLAYFGGENSTGFDYAGKNWDSKGNLIGGQPPGSSFKVYTLAAALENNISLQSHWKAKPFRDDGRLVENAGRNPKCGDFCTLEFSTLQSYNVPFYHITKEIGPDKVLDMAKAAGITTMWPNEGPAVDLTKTKSKDVAPSKFYHVLGYGQYRITVLDHAQGLATLAARGIYRKAHFVVTVEKKDPATGKWIKKAAEVHKPEKRIRPQVADDVTATLAKIPDQNGDDLNDGRDAAGKTGTWELSETSRENAHAWMVGYTPQMATAVWVGNGGSKQLPIKLKGGKRIGGSDLPADIWKRYMNAAHDGLEKQEFREPANIGDDEAGNGKAPEPTRPPTTPDCNIPIICPPPNGEGDRDRDGNGGGNGPGGNGPGFPGGGGGGSPPIILPPPPR
jgi:membrane peptidoglycan carboxypeptidase